MSYYIEIFGEDLVGWPNEGVRIKILRKLYELEIKGKKIELYMEPTSVILDLN